MSQPIWVILAAEFASAAVFIGGAVSAWLVVFTAVRSVVSRDRWPNWSLPREKEYHEVEDESYS